MKRRQRIYSFVLLLLTLTLESACVRAQDTPQEPADQQEANPKPAARAIPTIDTNTPEDNSSLQPDLTPLTGAQSPTLGTTEMLHSYWVPGFQLASNIESAPNGQGGTSWFANNYVIGNLSLLKAWSSSQFVVNYSGGGYFSTSSEQGNGGYQQLALSQTFQTRRWTFQVLDQFSYLPQSGFGFGGGTNLGTPGVGGVTGPVIPGLGGNYVPNQSIYASLGPRYSNAGVLQLSYQLTPSNSITASGSYGILRFVDAGNVDNNTVVGSLGFNHQLNRTDTIGVFYRFSSYQYPGEPQAFGDHSINLAYGKKLTGRLGLQVSGGPEFTEFRVPIGTETSKLGGSISANLTYRFENGGISAGYLHGLTGGSGVFTGSTADVISFALAHKLSRVWSGQFTLGYSKNRAVVTSTESAFPNYDSIYVGGNVSRPIGRDFIFAFAYTANIGKTNETSGCTTASCSSSQTFNYITISFQWHSRPLVLP